MKQQEAVGDLGSENTAILNVMKTVFNHMPIIDVKRENIIEVLNFLTQRKYCLIQYPKAHILYNTIITTDLSL